MTVNPTENAKTIDEFTVLTDPQSNDIFVIVKNRANTNLETRSITLLSLFTNASCNLVIANSSILSSNNFIFRNRSTPANSTITVSQGMIWFDSDYIYVATANNVVKRSALSSF